MTKLMNSFPFQKKSRINIVDNDRLNYLIKSASQMITPNRSMISLHGVVCFENRKFTPIDNEIWAEEPWGEREDAGSSGSDGRKSRATGVDIAESVCRFSVKSLCGLKHDRPESVPSYVSIKHRPRGRLCGCVRVHLTGRGRCACSYLDWFLRRNQEIINCPRGAGITNRRLSSAGPPPVLLPSSTLAGFCA